MTITTRVLQIVMVCVALLVVVNMQPSFRGPDGAAVAFLVWNVAPCIVAYMLLRRPGAKHPTVGFVLGVLTLTTFFHVSWMLDLGGLQTASSTSALIFLFAPIWSAVLGFMTPALEFGISKLPWAGVNAR